ASTFGHEIPDHLMLDDSYWDRLQPKTGRSFWWTSTCSSSLAIRYSQLAFSFGIPDLGRHHFGLDQAGFAVLVQLGQFSVFDQVINSAAADLHFGLPHVDCHQF